MADDPNNIPISNPSDEIPINNPVVEEPIENSYVPNPYAKVQRNDAPGLVPGWRADRQGVIGGWQDLPSAPEVPHGAAVPFVPGEFVTNPDGSWSNERTITSGAGEDDDLMGGKATVIPTLWRAGDKTIEATPDQARELAKRSGLVFPTFNTDEEAEAFSEAREKNWQNVKPGSAEHRAVAPLYSQYHAVTPSTPAFLEQPIVFDQMAQARSEGYSWADIQGFLAEKTAQARAAGYTDPEIATHLGYDDPKPMDDRLAATWRQRIGADPELIEKMGQPQAADAPISLLDQNARDNYAQGLMQGRIRDPLDFASRYGAAFETVMDDNGNPVIRENLKRSVEDMAAQLPNIQELNDASIALAMAQSGDPTSGQVANVRQNLMEEWADTGDGPMRLYHRALADPEFADKLNNFGMPEPHPENLAAGMLRIVEAAGEGGLINWRGFGADMSGGFDALGRGMKMAREAAPGPLGLVNSTALGLAGIVGGGLSVAERLGGTAVLPLIAGAHQLISEIFDKQSITPEEAAARASSFVNDVVNPLMGELGMRVKVGGARVEVPRISLLDPLAPGAEQFKTAPATDLMPRAPAELKPVLPASSEIQAERGVGYLEASRIRDQMKLEINGKEFTAPADAHPQSVLDAIVKETGENRGGRTMQEMAKDAGATPEVQLLAQGHDVASAIYATFHNLMVDESGSVANFFTTPARQMAKAAGIVERDFVQDAVRMYAGRAEQLIQHHFDDLEQYRKVINPMLRDYEKEIRQFPAGNLAANPVHQMLTYIEGRSTGVYMNPASPLKPVADAIRTVYQNMRQQIENSLPQGTMKNFYEDYYRHQWARPGQADKAFGMTGKQGTGMNLRKRSIPTLADGIQMGLMPKYLDPIENTLNYVQGMAQHLAARQVLADARGAGFVTYYKRGGAPADQIPLTGLASQLAVPMGKGKGAMIMDAHAPMGFAKSYNNWLSKGAYGNDRLGPLYERLLYGANAMTGLKLLMPTYHAMAMASESAIASIANGFGRLGQGEIIGGLKDLGFGLTVLPSVVETAMRGRRLQRKYLDMAGDPVSSLFADAGGRAVGRQNMYRFGAAPSIIQSISRRSLGLELSQDVRHILGTPDEAPAVRAAMLPGRVIGFAGKEVGRILNTVTGGLFDHLIPWLKQGAFGAEMDTYLRKNPTAQPEVLRRQARMLVDSMDNRFGELNQNNLFWPAYAKQIANLMLISTGWEYGSLRAFASAAQFDLDKMKMAYNPVAFRWALAFGVGVATQNALYQYARTGATPGQSPTPWLDLMAPRNGGKTPEGKPDRTLLPGYQKDVFGMIQAWRTNNVNGLIAQKASPMWKTLWTTLISGEDAIGHTIRAMPINGKKPRDATKDPMGAFMDRFHNYYTHVFAPSLLPIPFQAGGTRLRGTGITPLENMLGVRTAPGWMIDPERYAKGQAKREDMLKKQELGRARSENKRLETPDKTIPPAPTSKDRAFEKKAEKEKAQVETGRLPEPKQRAPRERTRTPRERTPRNRRDDN